MKIINTNSVFVLLKSLLVTDKSICSLCTSLLSFQLLFADTQCKKLIEKAWNSGSVEGIDFKSTGSYQ